jgi:hypothetical protein
MSCQTPEQRADVLGNVFNWLRNKGVADSINNPTGEFGRLDAMLPTKKSQSPEDSARENQGVSPLMRNFSLQ